LKGQPQYDRILPLLFKLCFGTIFPDEQKRASLEWFTLETMAESKQHRRMQEDFLSEWIHGLVFQRSWQDLEIAGIY